MMAEQLTFNYAQMFWGVINFMVLLAAIAIPIWILVKVNSIDKSLKELVNKLDK
ncbi:MAG TPA: hypothetical protein VNT57_01715 [Desulfobacteria bacterium]|nr:hypothetical protein [Desulfobacteria bacterium]